MNQPAHNQASENPEEEEQSQEEKEDSRSAEKISQDEQAKAFQEETPDIQEGASLLTNLLAIGGTVASAKHPLAESIDLINNPNYASRILNVRDQQGFNQAKEAVRAVEKEAAKQRASAQKKGKPIGEVKVGVLWFKKKINLTEFEHKKQAISFADVVHKRVTATEIKLKIDRAAVVYGVDPAQLKKDMASWLKQNKGRNIDDYLVVHGKELYCKQNGLDPKKKNKAVDEKGKELIKNFYTTSDKDHKSTRAEAIEKEKEVVARGREEINKSLDPQQTLLTPEQIKQREQHILRGAAQPPPPQAQAPTPQPLSQPATQPQPVPAASASPVRAPSSVPRISLINRFLDRIKAINRVIENIRNQIRNAISRVVQRALQRVRDMIRRFMERVVKRIIQAALNLMKRIVMKIATKIFSKAAIAAASALLGQILGSTLPGIGNAIMGALTTLASALGIDEMVVNFTINAAKFAIAVVAVVTFISILALPSMLQGMFPPSESQAQTFQTPPSTTQYTSWQQFEKENLILPLYSYRHDDVKK